MIWIIMGAYQIVLACVDVVYLFFQCLFLLLQAIYHMFDPPKMKSVAGEIILVTGAGHGIGKELCLQFSRLGAKVVCLDINEEWNKETVAQITKEGGTAWPFVCDVSKQDEVKAVSAKVRRLIGDPAILVNNAAIMPCKPFVKHTAKDVEKLFNINVYSHFWTLMEWLPVFLESGRGHVVAMSSLCGVMGTPNLVPYCASKFAITGLMDGLTEELRYGNQNPNIKFTTIHPYIVNTGLALKPRIRFPAFYPVVSTDECAQLVIESVRREEEVAFVPNREFYLNKILLSLPRKIQHAVLDFVDTGVDPHDCSD